MFSFWYGVLCINKGFLFDFIIRVLFYFLIVVTKYNNKWFKEETEISVRENKQPPPCQNAEWRSSEWLKESDLIRVPFSTENSIYAHY